MKKIPYCMMLIGLSLSMTSIEALAHRYGGGIARHHAIHRPYFGFYYGAPYAWPRYYMQPYYYPPIYSPPVYVMPQSPPLYIEPRPTPQPPSPNSSYWNYCSNPEGYFPHVQNCSMPWQAIPQQPAGEENGYWYYCNQPSGYYPYIRTCNERWQRVQP